VERWDLIVVGAGLAGLSAAITAHELGLRTVVLEKGERFGGASAASGGQVWVGANHVMARLGIEDSVEDALAYVHALAQRDATIFRPEVARQWVESGRSAARWFEELGVIRWETIPGMPDYYWPEAPGARAEGRYLTGALVEGAALGADRERLAPAPSFPVGLTYEELFRVRRESGRSAWAADLLERRRAEDRLSFGQGIAAAFAAATLARGIEIRTGHAAAELLLEGDEVAGVRCEAAGRSIELAGPVVLATGAHDWWEDAERYTRVPREDAGSVAPETLTGDGLALAAAAGAEILAVPPWAAPVIPGYRLPRPAFEGDTGFRACWEQSLPHCFLVNRAGRRFCDDSFHPAIARALLTPDELGELPNLPFFMIWDENHHERYGLGASLPGERYPEGLVTSAPTLAELGRALGIDAEGLVATAERFNGPAAEGRDPEFGRGTNRTTQVFRGDPHHRPNPNVGPVERPPFYGMRMRLVSTGITAAGVRSGLSGRAERPDGSVIRGLHAVGEAAARTAGGAGYNSGYSLGRALTFGWLAARDVAEGRA
jgi:3-oxosteroid 1-dehydrogenase